MAYATTEYRIGPSDGWVKVADDAVNFVIKSHTPSAKWYVAVTATGAPAAGIIGLPMGGGDEDCTFEGGDLNVAGAALTAEVYIRAGRMSDAVTETLFTVITA